ncbi:DUF3772 domain-containing protein [Vannielia litorea]|uniref:DUF3772 domain-containing protein n=1 Tax=Vannielia litorea TaxID=1217970 RepID=UPI001C98781F|nr:DUF3772 domain-containing protein [Vannielia litorea]MBY6047625.1 DUF3772 domain-containing protein [Vannielia litorea]MBY6075039.1 DUF3772 domain-containing protein [Vannielia litorea]
MRLLLLLSFLATAALPVAGQAQSLADDLVNGAGEPGATVSDANPGDEGTTVPAVTDALEAASLSLPGGPDYEAWEKVASQAEDVLDSDGASSLALEQLRERLADWRIEFQDAQSTNSGRIDILRRQIDALGPAPAEGETEAVELAQRRDELTSQLSRLLVPIRAAEEAYIRADGLIGEVDAVLRDRQTRELLDVGPSPLFPNNWAEPLEQLGGVGETLRSNLRSSWENQIQQAKLSKNAAPAIIVALIGLILVIRGRGWSMRLSERLLTRSGRQQRTVIFAMLVSVGQLLLPQIGLVLIVVGVTITGIGGLLTDQVLQTIPVMGILIFGARWLGFHSFPKIEILPPPLEHDAAQRTSGRLWATMAGVSGALGALLLSLTAFSGITEEAAAFLNFPVLLLGAVALFRLGQLLVVHARGGAGEEIDEHTSKGFRARVVHLIGRAAVLLALAGPVMAALGYLKAGDFLISAPLSTLAVLAVVSLLQRFFSHLYALFFGRQADGTDGLVAVLISFLIMLLALPLLALIWGARTADLTELWSQFMGGFSVGESTISPSNFLLFAVVFVLGFMVTRLLQGALRTSVLPKTRIDTGGQTAILSGVSYIGIFLAAVIAITAAGIDLSSLAIVAGALSVGIGFGLQTIVSNFVSGIILLIERPISEGDWISSGGVMGIVKKISVRSTRIETFDKTDVIVPNADLISGQVTNYTKTNMSGRLLIPVGVAYGSDTRKVAEVLQGVAEEHPIVILNPPPQVVFTGFGADSLDFEIRVILRDVFSIIVVQTEIRHRIAERFKEEGIEIPFAQRDLWLRNPEALGDAIRGARAGGAVVEAEPVIPGTEATPPEEPETPSRAAARAGLTQDDFEGGGDGGGDR